ncbi:MAG TPA: hypothetical protein PKA88_03895 [Polyangiaceae bacterium]|nr:hypothetical protein [Polyangiaceae bacterium]
MSRLLSLWSVLLLCACGSESASGSVDDVDAGGADVGAPDATVDTGALQDVAADSNLAEAASDATSDAAMVDEDGDGLDDGLELQTAKAYFPFYSLDPADKCPRHGVLFRLSPHPDNPNWLAAWYVVLFERDCGLTAHVGDNEVFGAVIDPSQAAPAGLLALRAIAHQATLCSNTTTCGTLPGCSPCTLSSGKPVVFSSVNKHGGYVKEQTCDLNVICDLGGCTLNPTPTAPPFVNAGEPGKPLVTDLSQDGFITPALGWTETSLFGFNPWGGQDFGKAGNVTDDLTDPAFLVPAAGCN